VSCRRSSTVPPAEMPEGGSLVEVGDLAACTQTSLRSLRKLDCATQEGREAVEHKRATFLSTHRLAHWVTGERRRTRLIRRATAWV